MNAIDVLVTALILLVLAGIGSVLSAALKKANREVELPLAERFAEMDVLSSLLFSRNKPDCVRFQSEVFWPESSGPHAELEPPLSELMRAASQVWGKPLRSTGVFELEENGEVLRIPVEEGAEELPVAAEGWAKLLAERQRANRQVRLAVDESITGAGAAAYLQIFGGKPKQVRWESRAFFDAAMGDWAKASSNADAGDDSILAPRKISENVEVVLAPSLGALTGSVTPELLRAASEAWGKPLRGHSAYRIEPGAIVIGVEEEALARAA